MKTTAGGLGYSWSDQTSDRSGKEQKPTTGDILRIFSKRRLTERIQYTTDQRHCHPYGCKLTLNRKSDSGNKKEILAITWKLKL